MHTARPQVHSRVLGCGTATAHHAHVPHLRKGSEHRGALLSRCAMRAVSTEARCRLGARFIKRGELASAITEAQGFTGLQRAGSACTRTHARMHAHVHTNTVHVESSEKGCLAPSLPHLTRRWPAAGASARPDHLQGAKHMGDMGT